eukprot:PLAT4724.1.p1 GENE.PLAT4724.1~~PLAT4724.1.p1  ORF type:complete len:221 (+),score=72.87 PLAT4724.1:2-664(+)
MAARRGVRRAAKAVGPTFLGPSLPAEVRPGLAVLKKLDPRAFGFVLSSAARVCLGESLSPEVFEEVAEESGLGEQFTPAFTAAFLILKAAVKSRAKLTVMEAQLENELGLKREVIGVFTRLMERQREAMESAAFEDRIRFPQLDDLKWRVDVTLSTSSLSRVLRPSVLMQMTLSDGRIKTFEVPVEKFHQLRFNTAKVLKGMRSLESHPIMRIPIDIEER